MVPVLPPPGCPGTVAPPHAAVMMLIELLSANFRTLPSISCHLPPSRAALALTFVRTFAIVVVNIVAASSLVLFPCPGDFLLLQTHCCGPCQPLPAASALPPLFSLQFATLLIKLLSASFR